MDQTVKKLFSKEIVRQSAELFGIDQNSLENMNGFQNFVYSGVKGESNVVLRIAHMSHRSEELTLAELEFVSYLGHSGMSVCKPILSIKGELLHIVDNSFIVTVFEMAAGRHANIAEESDTFYGRIGTFTGDMHRLSKRFQSQHNRYHWSENAYLTTFKKYCPQDLHDSFDQIIHDISILPKDSQSYGLIHGDISSGNYLNNQDYPQIIDFDQSEYSWFASDIATPLFYEIPIPWVVNESIRKDITKRFFSNFMNGYNKKHNRSNEWLNTIPLFIDLRQVVVLSALYRSRDFRAQDWSEWDDQAMKFYRSNLLHRSPYIDLEFSEI